MRPDPTVSQTSVELGISVATVWRRIADGTLETYKIGRLRRVKRASLDRLRGINGDEAA